MMLVPSGVPPTGGVAQQPGQTENQQKQQLGARPKQKKVWLPWLYTFILNGYKLQSTELIFSM